MVAKTERLLPGGSISSSSAKGDSRPPASPVTWTYNPYEIAPYAMGAIELAVRWSDLKPYLK